MLPAPDAAVSLSSLVYRAFRVLTPTLIAHHPIEQCREGLIEAEAALKDALSLIDQSSCPMTVRTVRRSSDLFEEII